MVTRKWKSCSHFEYQQYRVSLLLHQVHQEALGRNRRSTQDHHKHRMHEPAHKPDILAEFPKDVQLRRKIGKQVDLCF